MDPDQLASEKPADLDLHCFLTKYIRAQQEVTVCKFSHSYYHTYWIGVLCRLR